jgi:predicted transcriptional regulator
LTASTPVIIIGMVFGLVSFTEAGKFKIFTVFLIPLYSKIKKDQILDHFTRGQIYQYIKRNPGETYSTIKKELDLKNGTLTHHLKIMEKGGLIHSARNGLFRHFYPKEMPIPKTIFRLNHAQQDIVWVVKGDPGINQVVLAERIGLTPATVDYHLGFLIDADIIHTKKKGNSKRCYLKSAD